MFLSMAPHGLCCNVVLPFPLPIPEKKSKEANAIEKAIKPDCRTAYAGLGLLAVPALAAAAITGERCRWYSKRREACVADVGSVGDGERLQKTRDHVVG